MIFFIIRYFGVNQTTHDVCCRKGQREKNQLILKTFSRTGLYPFMNKPGWRFLPSFKNQKGMRSFIWPSNLCMYNVNSFNHDNIQCKMLVWLKAFLLITSIFLLKRSRLTDFTELAFFVCVKVELAAHVTYIFSWSRLFSTHLTNLACACLRFFARIML